MNKIIKNTVILTLITLIAGICLGAVYEITKEPIAQAQDAAKKEAWQQYSRMQTQMILNSST